MPSHIGQRIPRFEDLRLVRGAGEFTDDVASADAYWAQIVRSPYAHARIVSIDVDEARHAPGVIAVLTARDYLSDGHRGIPQMPNPADAIDHTRPAFIAGPGDRPVLDLPQLPIVGDRVRFVGEAVVMIVARTLAQARDAADLVVVDYDELPAVVTIDAAMAADAPKLYDEAPGNIALALDFGDAEATARAFDGAHLVVEAEFVNQRLVSCHMEPRAAIGSYDPQRDVYTLVAGSQGVVRQRASLAVALGVPRERIEVICPDVGGSFGSRTNAHPEAILVVWAAKRVGRAVRWRSDRSEGFQTDFQGRDMTVRAAMALNADGTIRGMRASLYGNIGAHTVAYAPLQNCLRILTTVYEVPAATAHVCGVMTNTTPTAPYRGAGRPEATFTMERLLDIAARRLDLDRVEIRRRNIIKTKDLPYHTPMGLTYDSGDFADNMRLALERAEWHTFADRRAESMSHGKLRGIGFANYVEAPVGAPREKVVLHVGTDRTVEILAGTQSTGQGHETTYAQVVADHLGVPMESVTLVTGDSRRVDVGGGSHSNRSMRLAGALLVQASAEIVERASSQVAESDGVPRDQITFDNDGVFRNMRSGRSRSLFEIAETFGPFSASAEFFGRMAAHPTGCAVCELEIDPQTGEVTIVRYTSVDDAGQPINPLILDGQIHGGIAQGVGQALYERSPIDPESGQVTGGSFMDYAVPRAYHLPHLDVVLSEHPTAGNPLRVKGGGEGGLTPAPAAVINAVVDALAGVGVEHVPTPATPETIWQLLEQARRARSVATAH